MDGNCRGGVEERTGWELQGGGVEERTGWEGEDKRTKWSERGKEEKRGVEGRANFLLFFWCVLFFLDPPKKPGPYFLNYTP